MINSVNIFNTAVERNYTGVDYDIHLGYVKVYHPISLEQGKPYLVCEGEFINGAKHGRWVYVSYSGEVLAQGQYKNDLMDGSWFFNNADGLYPASGKVEYKNGICLSDINEFPEANCDMLKFLDLAWY